MAILVATNGPEAQRRYDLDRTRKTPYVIGRHPECDIVVEDTSVSRRHAEILFDGGDFYVKDLKSRNFTYLNGNKVELREPLHPGDKISICNVEFRFELEQPSGLVGRPEGGPDVLFEDEDSSSSTIMSQVGVSSSYGTVPFPSSPQARLDALLDITRDLGGVLNLNQVLPKALNNLFKVFVQADRGCIALKGEGSTLIPRWTKARREDVHETIRISRTIAQKVMDDKAGMLWNDLPGGSQIPMSQSIAELRIRSVMCAPLIDSNGVSIGVLQIDTLDQRKRFQEDDLKVLVAVATQAGIAIDNAQLHEETLRQRAFERDLELAREVQTSFLPRSRPELAQYCFYDFYQPANHVGGDYYDYVHLPDGRSAVIVADVVGHGVAAALLMAKLSAEARFCLAIEADPAAAMVRLNDNLSRLHIDRFVTLVMAVLNPSTHDVTIVNAGHPRPIRRRTDGQVDEPGTDAAGIPLGIAEGMDFAKTTFRLEPGEILTMFTDGINEASQGEEMYGVDRVRGVIRSTTGSALEIGEAIVDDVRRFLTDATQEDDMCVVAFGRTA